MIIHNNTFCETETRSTEKSNVISDMLWTNTGCSSSVGKVKFNGTSSSSFFCKQVLFQMTC